VGSVWSLSLFVAGTPVPKARPRVTEHGTFTPRTTQSWENTVAWEVTSQVAALRNRGARLPLPFSERVILGLRFNLRRPKSTPKRVEHKLTKPDYDNLAKAVTDALQNAELFVDDNLVTDATIAKRFASDERPEGVEIEVTAWA